MPDRDPSAVTFSFIAPVFNEAGSLPTFYQRLKAVAEKLGGTFEIILINDGSTDESLKVMQQLHRDDDRVKYVDLSRNFGQQEALTAGYDLACGRAVISLDADCQHPPGLIPELVARWSQGSEVVYTVRTDTAKLSPGKRWASRTFYRLFKAMSGIDVADQADFRLLDRKVVEALKHTRERARFLRGLVGWMGFRQSAVPYQADVRYAGSSGYSLRKMSRLARAGLLNFSLAPLRIMGIVGAVLTAGALLYALIALAAWPFIGASPTANLVVFLLGILGVQLAGMGVLGEYVGRVFEEVKNRPIYIVRDAVGFEAAKEEDLSGTALEAPRTAPAAPPSGIRLFT
jgi:dolichol-phosphate mannosyltransferase